MDNLELSLEEQVVNIKSEQSELLRRIADIRALGGKPSEKQSNQLEVQNQQIVSLLTQIRESSRKNPTNH